MRRSKRTARRDSQRLGRTRTSRKAGLRSQCPTKLSRTVVQRLGRIYPSVDLGNKQDPLDELVFIILSQMTTSVSYIRVFDRLKARFPRWDALADARVSCVRRVIKDAGLSGQKAPRLKRIMRRLRSDFGKATLMPLATLDDKAATEYLLSLPGVGLKTAKCVLMYSLGRKVLPIDTHVARVAWRLGLLERPAQDAAAHDHLEGNVRKADRHRFHVLAVVHGRNVCTHTRPACVQCPLLSVCRSANVPPRNVRLQYNKLASLRR